ncbi:ABC transporter substrate-binding protein [Streptomyces coeruleoprunus]|uniref:ABC transporter substrate-binding protein n=1 Tax=Streptomyces coeruleoprunus TaxID=285563 RepID=A0ABV9XCA7_9ACTN
MHELGEADPRQVGRYRILARLGVGGMGRVYLGRSTSGRMVAVKVVRAELAEDPDFRRRFAREVEAARRVTGFFTAAVVDADPEGSPAWLATAYVPGMPLDEAVRAHGAWARRSLLVLGAGLVEALEAIHGAGLIHRDLKPSNVLLAGDGPRVIDFGISIASEASVLTRTGMVVGTPGFMSPEQVTGRTVGPASDVFALGAVLAFAGTGAAPFGTGSPHSVNFRAVYEEPELGGLPAGTGFVGRCLAKDPGRRPTVPELLAEFAQLLGDAGGQTYGVGLPQETDWLPEAVATALTDRTTARTAPRPAANPEPPQDPRVPADAVPGPDPRVSLDKKPEPAAVPPAPAPAEPPALVDREPARAPATPTPAIDEIDKNDKAVPTPTGPAAPTAPPLSPPAQAPAPEAPRPSGPPATEPLLVSTRTPASPTSPGRLPTQPPGRARRRRLVAIALVAALVTGGGITALLANLGKGKSHGAEGEKSSSTAPAGFDAAVGKVVNASDKKGGTLRLLSRSDADSWDPARSYYGWVWNMQRLYARTLLAYDAKPGRQGLNLVPDLAAAQPQVSPDGRTYTVRLKSGLQFEDGTPITSQDVKYGIERVFAQDVLSGGPVHLIESLDQGQNYQGPYKGGGAGKSGLRSVETPDDRTLVFRLAEADSRFPYLLAMGATSPVPRKRDTGARYGKEPVSSGPYKFASYTPSKSLVLVRNEHWDRATDPLRKALPDRIELSFSTNPEEVGTRLVAGLADLDAQQGGLSQRHVSKVLQDPKLKAQTDAPYTGYLRYVSLVSKTAPLDNVHCRKAVLYAADTTALQTARGGPTAGSRHGNMLPPTMPGADDYDPFGLTGGKPQPEKAREELRACGKPNGFTTKLVVRNNRPKDVASAEALQQALKAVGITVEILQRDETEFLTAVRSPGTVKENGYGLIVVAWGADYAHGSGFLRPLADGRLIAAGDRVNYAQINDPRINALFAQAETETDAAKASGIYRRINHKVTDGAYYLPVVADKALNYRHPRLTNVYVHEAYGMVDIQALGTSDGT